MITPTVTMPIDKFNKVRTDSVPGNLFDTDGNYFSAAINPWDPLGELAPLALMEAAELGSDYDFSGNAFHGILGFNFVSPLSPQLPNQAIGFTKPPVVRFVGGNIEANNDSPHPNFVQAKADAILNETGGLVSINITYPGAYYYNSPSIFLDDQNYSDYIAVNVGHLCVSYVVLTTYETEDLPTAPPVYGGVGWVGLPGSHVTVGFDWLTNAEDGNIKYVASPG